MKKNINRLKMNITLEEFEKKIKNNIFSESKIDNLCKYKESNNLNSLLYILILVLIISLIYEIYRIYNENQNGSDNLKVVQIA